MQPMGSRQLAPKGMWCSGVGELYGGGVWILCGPGIVGDAFRLLYRNTLATARTASHSIAACTAPKSSPRGDSGVSVERRGVVYARQVLSAFVIQLNPMVMFRSLG